MKLSFFASKDIPKKSLTSSITKMKKTLMFSAALFAAAALNAADTVVEIVDPANTAYKGVEAGSSLEDGVIVNISTTQPNNSNATASLTVVNSSDIATSNMKEENGEVVILDKNKDAVTVSMNGGALTSIKGVAGASNVYGNVVMNINGGLLQDSSSGVGAIIGSSNLATSSKIYGDININIGNTVGDPQPAINKSTVLGMGMGTLYGSTNVVINGGDISSSSSMKGLCAGANWGGVIEGDSNLTIKDGAISCFVAGGNFNTKSTGYAVIKGSANVVIEGGSLNNVYSGNYALTGATTAAGTIEGDANLTISGGTMGDVRCGGGTIGGNVVTNISGGEMLSVYASYGTVGGTSSLHITGGTFSAIYGAYQGASTGDVNVIIEKGSIKGNITGARSASAKGDGNINVVFAGSGSDIVFANTSKVQGRDTAAAKAGSKVSLLFGNNGKAFNGTFNAEIADFDSMSLAEGSDVAIAKAISGVKTLSIIDGSTLTLSGDASAAFDDIAISEDSKLIMDGTTLALNEGGTLSLVLGSEVGERFINLCNIISFSAGGDAFWSGISKDNIMLLNSDGSLFGGDWDFSSDENGFVIGVNVPEPAAMALLFGAAALAMAYSGKRRA